MLLQSYVSIKQFSKPFQTEFNRIRLSRIISVNIVAGYGLGDRGSNWVPAEYKATVLRLHVPVR